LRCVRRLGICKLNLNSLALIVSEIFYSTSNGYKNDQTRIYCRGENQRSCKNAIVEYLDYIVEYLDYQIVVEYLDYQIPILSKRDEREMEI